MIVESKTLINNFTYYSFQIWNSEQKNGCLFYMRIGVGREGKDLLLPVKYWQEGIMENCKHIILSIDFYTPFSSHKSRHGNAKARHKMKRNLNGWETNHLVLNLLKKLKVVTNYCKYLYSQNPKSIRGSIFGKIHMLFRLTCDHDIWGIQYIRSLYCISWCDYYNNYSNTIFKYDRNPTFIKWRFTVYKHVQNSLIFAGEE